MKTKTSIYHRTFAFAYVLLVAVIFCGCEIPENKQQYTKTNTEYDNGSYKIVEIDSCEYVLSMVYGGRSICHKGNCKFCTERSKK
jgi:hypothetical protein